MHSHYMIGFVYERDGKLIYVTGQKQVGNLNLPNMFTWREVKKNGKLGAEASGYGGLLVSPVECEIDIRIKLKETVYANPR